MHGDGSGEMNTVDQAGVDRVGQDHLGAGLGDGQQRVQHAVESAGHADALAVLVIPAAAQPLDVGRRGLAQLALPFERQVAVRGVRVDRATGHIEGDGWGPQIGVQVLQAQHGRVSGRVGPVTDHVHPDARDLPQPADRHRDLRAR